MVVLAICRCSSEKSSGVNISCGWRSSVRKLPPLTRFAVTTALVVATSLSPLIQILFTFYDRRLVSRGADLSLRRAEAQCHLLFGKLESAQPVGRTPRSARDALVPLFPPRITRSPLSKSRPGGRLRTRGSAPPVVQNPGVPKSKRHWANVRPTSSSSSNSRKFPPLPCPRPRTW
jgi:hypothetical protein